MIRIGDLIQDNHNRLGIVEGTGFMADESQAWILAQEDTRVRDLEGDEVTLHVLPLSGGAVVCPESLAKRIRRATREDFAAAEESANWFGKESLKRLPLPRR